MLLVALGFVIALGACRPGLAPSPQVRLTRHVVLISLDGFRADYITRPVATHLQAIAARGVRAERMITVFPSKTFPNHYSIVTGLTAEEHGVVANVMRDPVLGPPVMRALDKVIRGCPEPLELADSGHFVQEDGAPIVAAALAAFASATKAT